MPQAEQAIQDLAPGGTIATDVEGQPVTVANVAGRLYAFDDLCTHRQCSLAQGELDGVVVTCPCHGSQFDVTTGAVVRGPAREPLATYQVELVDGVLQVGAATGSTAAPEDRAEAEAVLSQVPFFSGLDAASIEALRSFTFQRTFQPGELIVEEGRTGNGLYVITSGNVEVVRGLPERPQVVTTLGDGEPFGELALLGDWKRTASVRAVTETTCLGIDRWVFLAYLRQHPDLAIRMLQVLAQRLVETDEKLFS